MAACSEQGVSGTVRISASEAIGVEVLPPMLAQLYEMHTELKIQLVPTDRAQDLACPDRMRRGNAIPEQCTLPLDTWVRCIKTYAAAPVATQASTHWSSACKPISRQPATADPGNACGSLHGGVRRRRPASWSTGGIQAGLRLLLESAHSPLRPSGRRSLSSGCLPRRRPSRFRPARRQRRWCTCPSP
jgi:DNA-binding transcriptional LysR family regulator